MIPDQARSGEYHAPADGRRTALRLREWEKLVAPYFDFLGEYGFGRAPQLDRADGWATTITYATTQHAVRVTSSVEFRRAEVELVRLHQGALPEPMIFFDDGAPFDRTLLDDVVIARASDRTAETEATGVSKAELRAQLATWSGLLKAVAADFLAGDDGVFNDARAVVRQRVTDNPQEIIVWLPEDADAEREAGALREARASAPPSVEVVVRRYRR